MKIGNDSRYKHKYRKLILSSGDIQVPRTQKFKPYANIHLNLKRFNQKFNTENFVSLNDDRKQGTSLDEFHGFDRSVDRPIKKSLDVKQRLKSLEIRPERYRIKSTVRSKTLVPDNNFDKCIKRELFSGDIGQLRQPALIDKLNPKFLTDYEKEEIKAFKNVYYIGHKAYRRKHQKDKLNDLKGNYRPLIGDHIGYRFEIIRILGSGAFGKVLEVFDHKTKHSYALKILKQSEQLYEQFQFEIKILKIVRNHSSTNKNIIEIKGDFEFRGHICIIMQLLSINLYSFIKDQNYQGLSLEVIRKILIQILQALTFLHHRNIIHCDIKLENIVFRELGKSGMKLIDFGSACFYDRKEFTYIQSRYYRAPEIILIKPYDRKIDIWSMGCVLFELFTGTPLFPSRNENEQMSMINVTLGPPSLSLLSKCERGSQFRFEANTNLDSIRKRLKCDNESFVNLIEQMVKWVPEDRIEAIDALKHPFITEGLPKTVKAEHIKQMQSNNPYNLLF